MKIKVLLVAHCFKCLLLTPVFCSTKIRLNYENAEIHNKHVRRKTKACYYKVKTQATKKSK